MTKCQVVQAAVCVADNSKVMNYMYASGVFYISSQISDVKPYTFGTWSRHLINFRTLLTTVAIAQLLDA